MFSGLVAETGRIVKITQDGETIELVVEPHSDDFLTTAQLGDSIAVNGTCLTIVEINNNQFMMTLMPQTFEKTTFKNLEKGSLVNLERSLQIGARLEGHIVTGHVDELSRVLKRTVNENAIEVQFSLPQRLHGQVVAQGSVAINGVSLTVMETGDDWFTVGLIPHTQLVTNLDTLKVGDEVNLETDILGKYVVANLLGGRK
ncbi:riboflavin synthase [Limosilactobacillus reuteri]|uniref:riboflavin synthase n=1 Tax=Limosilactobacillus reuteri TaxID=1598 RepID=UPI00128E53AF|nr:riboflavin synthase [Limosilactobacillus reuteri]MQB64619.1 riboflavin synthase [Limosilactobacillus reuteri]MQB75942.1 riboflavin synthase [Limosilactobacillus reuteri]MQB97999.1 riboflavin synthase [Limosilactobacillus reuteri]